MEGITMITNVKFLDNSFQLAVWCFNTLKQHGIQELKGFDKLVENKQRYLQLHLKSSVDDSEILLEKVREDETTHKPIYRFVYKVYSNVTFTYYSAEFKLNNK